MIISTERPGNLYAGRRARRKAAGFTQNQPVFPRDSPEFA
jgi:hypothetical protein